VNAYITKLILEGEHQKQDFKYCISDSRKIAKSLVAFANTDGGRLLIGVKDNGNIAGVRSDEEFYMIDSAAKIFSRPQINFYTHQHQIDGKIILEIIVESSPNKPHFALDENGSWLAYYRQQDENKLANRIMIQVWHKQRSKKGILINYSSAEKFLLDYLKENGGISFSAFTRKAHITSGQAEQILSDFIVLGILKLHHQNKKISYTLDDQFDRKSWENENFTE